MSRNIYVFKNIGLLRITLLFYLDVLRSVRNFGFLYFDKVIEFYSLTLSSLHVELKIYQTYVLFCVDCYCFLIVKQID